MDVFTTKVAEFHRLFGHPIATSIGDEDLAVRQLRIKLLFEELEELAVASHCEDTFWALCQSHDERMEHSNSRKGDGNDVDHVEELDALCDLMVVLTGKILTSGHYERFEDAFAEVHSSNMSKACGTEDEASIAAYEYSNKGVHVNKEHRGDYWVLVRDDGKIMKGPHFEPPQLKQYV